MNPTGAQLPPPSEFMTWIGRDCDMAFFMVSSFLGFDQNLWPELEGIVTLNEFSPLPRNASDQNLWPELEGIVTK